jgi:hypothetical protein
VEVAGPDNRCINPHESSAFAWLDVRRIGRVAQTLVAWRTAGAGVEAAADSGFVAILGRPI